MTDIIEVMAKGALEEASSLDPKQWMTAALKAAKAEGWELVRLPEPMAGVYCIEDVEHLDLEP